MVIDLIEMEEATGPYPDDYMEMPMLTIVLYSMNVGQQEG
jgi:hypothetical protein